jgi:hypothetical protein
MADGEPDPESSDSSTSGPLDYTNDDGWADMEEQAEAPTFVSLFDDKTFADLNELLRYCHATYNFDFWQVRKTLGVPPAHTFPNGCPYQPSVQLTQSLGQAWII